MRFPSPISLVAANIEAQAGAAGALFSWILLFAASYFISRFLIRKLRPGRKPSKSVAVVYFLGVFVVLTLGTSIASYWLLTKAMAQKTVAEKAMGGPPAVKAVEKDWGKKDTGGDFSGTLWTRLDGSKLVYRFALDQEPFSTDVAGQGFTFLDSRGVQHSEQILFFDDFTKSTAQDGTDFWLAEGIMDKPMNPKTYQSLNDWMIVLIPR